VDASKYSVIEQLRDGRNAEIRALRPDDQAELLAALDRSSTQTLYRRFFAAKRSFSDREIEFFSSIDFTNHVALVVVVEEGSRRSIVAGGRYIVLGPGAAEIAFVVIDQYQGQGIGATLMRHLVAIAREAGLKELIAEVLPDNAPMLKVFEKCGLQFSRARKLGVVHVALRL